MIDIEDLFTPLTKDQIETSMLDILEALNMPARSWQSGGVARTIVATVAQKISDFTGIISLATKSGFLDTAETDWLTLLAHYVYNVDRIPARSASGTITLTNASGGSYVVGVGDLHVAHQDSGAVYTNTTGGTIPAGPGGTLDLEFQADVVGTGSDAAPSFINIMVTPLSGVTCSNPDAFSGLNEEEDEDLRQRCREALGALSPNGQADAYAFIAKSTEVAVTRVKVTPNTVDGSVEVLLAKVDGGLTGGEVTTVNDAIQTQCVPAGITCTVATAVELALPVSASVSVYESANIDGTTLANQIETALINYINSLPIGGDDIGSGGFVSQVALASVIRDVLPAKIALVQVTDPGSDVTVADSEVVIYNDSGTIIVSFVPDP